MIKYVMGDATHPQGDGRKIIAHVCNDIGGWGRGFVLALNRRWSKPEAEYRRWSSPITATQIPGGYVLNNVYSKIDSDYFAPTLLPPFGLGLVQFVNVEDDITIANMVAQHDVRTIDGIPPIRYDALREALIRVLERSKLDDASIHMPRIGCGLAGGNWVVVEGIINEVMPDIRVYVYDLPNNPIPWK